MKNTFIKYFCFFLLLLIESCTQPITFRNLPIGGTGHFMFGKIPERKFFDNISISDSLQLLWSTETSGSQSYTSITIYNDILFIGDLSGKIYAFDRKTGKSQGYEKYTGSISVTPVINNLRLYFITNELNHKYCFLKCYDFLGGKILSESLITGNVQNEILKLKDGIIVITDSGEIIKFNFVGFREWSVTTNSTIKSSPASIGELVLFGNEKGELVAVSSKNGEIKYRVKLSSGIESGITIDESIVYFGDNQGKIYSVNISDGKLNWKYDSKSKILATPVFNDNRIYFGNLSGGIFCLNKNDGKLIWKTETPGVINTTPQLFSNFLVQPDLNKKIYFINTQNGKIERTYEFGTRVKLSPVYYDGILYLGADKGIINACQTFSK